ncbi:MAG: hypothetical protein ABI550_07805 [Ignavibacteriaceae bacterium]
MMGKNINFVIIGFLIFAILGFFIYQYIFSIYEVTYLIKPEKLFADNHSTVSILAEPLNSFGLKAPFRNSYTDFEITEGEELIEVILEDKETGKLIIKAKDKTGKVVIHIKTKYALLPSSVEILIYPNAA